MLCYDVKDTLKKMDNNELKNYYIYMLRMKQFGGGINTPMYFKVIDELKKRGLHQIDDEIFS